MIPKHPFRFGVEIFGAASRIEGVLASPHVLLGSVEQIAGKLERNREKYGISCISIFEGNLVNFAPAVSF